MTAFALFTGSLLSLPRWRQWRVSLPVLANGIFGLLGYHLFYFVALRWAPALEANLINYLWPLLIVVLSPLFLRAFPLRPHHVVGAILGFSGAGLIITNGELALQWQALPGYLLAGCAAVTWAVYSLMTRRLPAFPSSAVGGFGLISALIALSVHVIFEPSWQFNQREFIGLLLLGFGPMGAAFYLWDAAMKNGDPRRIGALAYFTPLASTLLLVLAGGKALTALAGWALALIMAGAWLGGLRR